MNNSWLKTSQSSPGFLYFNTNKTPNTSNTSSPEFIGFSDIPSPGRNNFSPQNYSSPQNFGKRFNTGQQPPQKKWRKNNYSDKPYQNRSFNTNNSFNSSFNNSSSRNSSFGNKSKVDIHFFILVKTAPNFNIFCVRPTQWRNLKYWASPQSYCTGLLTLRCTCQKKNSKYSLVTICLKYY